VYNITIQAFSVNSKNYNYNYNYEENIIVFRDIFAFIVFKYFSFVPKYSSILQGINDVIFYPSPSDYGM